MFSQRNFLFSATATIVPLCVALGGLPERPAILHGQLQIDGRTVLSTDDVTLLARVDGVAEPVGTYHMGEIPEAIDNYVLRIRLESRPNGEPPSDDAAAVGQVVRVFVRIGNGTERAVGEFMVAESGTIELADLHVEATFGLCTDGDSAVDLRDYAVFQDCLTGVGGQIELECGCADFDADQDADLMDFAQLQASFSNGG